VCDLQINWRVRKMAQAPTFDWCLGLSVVAIGVSAICLALPAPKITATFKSNTGEFLYRILMLPVLLWYDVFASLTIIVGSFKSDEGWHDDAAQIYAVSAGTSAAVVLSIIVFVLFHDTCLWRCCCACCPQPSGGGLPQWFAAQVVRRGDSGGSISAQKKVISMCVAALITALITPQYSQYTTTTSIGVFITVVCTLALGLVGMVVGDRVADAVVYIQFSLLAAGAFLISMFYALAGDWAHNDSKVYVTAACLLVGLTVAHVAYTYLILRYCYRCCCCFGDDASLHLKLLADEGEKEDADQFEIASMPVVDAD
jgi:hypothetical protein